MSLNASTVDSNESCRKRQIDRVADAEAQPNPSRLRVSPKQERYPSGHDHDDYKYYSEPESNFTSAGEVGSDKEDTRDSGYEHDGDEVVNSKHTLVKQEDDGSNPASPAVPQSWEEASEMKRKGLSRDEVEKAWKEGTGQESARIVLLNHYNRPDVTVRILKEGDSERLLAAVQEVKAIFEREKWQLVKNAMIRAGAAEYSKGFIQRQYKKLARDSQKAKTAGGHNEKRLPYSKGIGSMKESHVANGATAPDSAPVKPVHSSLGLRLIETIHTRTDPSPYRAEVSAGTPSDLTSTVQKSKKSGPAKTRAQMKGATEDPDTKGKETAKGRLPAKPGSLATNAILLDDTDPAPSPVPKVNGPGTPELRVVANSAASGSRLSANTPSVLSRPGPSLGITPSRVGSATNWGPARFTSLHKAMDDDATRKQRNALNASFDPTKDQPGRPPVDALSGVSSIPEKKGPLECTNGQQRMAVQQGLSGEDGSPQIQSHLQHAPLVSSPQPTQASTHESTSTQHSITPPPISRGLAVGEAPMKPLPYQKPSDIQTPLQREGTRQQSPIRSIEGESLFNAVTPNNIIDAPSARGESSRGLTKPVTTDQLKHMLKYRTLNDTNRCKSWEIIANECGVTATLTDVSLAFEQAGFPSILNASEPLGPADHAASAPLTESKTQISPYAPAPSQTSPTNEASATPAVSAAPTRAFETPPPAITTSQDGTPSTRSRRGRPPGSKNRPKYQVRREGSSMSPSQTTTPVSGQKGHKKSAETKAAQSAAMKAAWKRRKEKETNGQRDSSPKPSTGAGQSFVGSLTATFAADILAAAAANTNTASTLAPPSPRTSAPPTGPDPLDDEAVDLLTGESMFAQHHDDPPPARFPGPPPAKKIVRRSIASRPI